MHSSRSVFFSFRWLLLPALLLSACATTAPVGNGSGGLSSLTTLVQGTFSRESSADAVEGLSIPPGEEFVLARVEGPAIIDRLWI
ncbi:MAG: hypothetical protein VX498_06655, partial [Myxococcota bacterium]|nr:hypothetical protein [Myxococcota bacterium]